jgi:RND family efflux transporter MFP subunit
MMSRAVKLTLLGTILVLGAGAYALLAPRPRGSAVLGVTAEPPSQAGDASTSSGEERVRVKVVRPQPHGLERSVTRPASVHAFEYANLYAKVSGYLQNQNVDIGSEVHKGQVLADIEAPELKTNVEKARADLDQAQAQVALKQAQLDVAQAEKSLREKEYARYKARATKQAIEPEVVDEKRAAAAAAEAGVKKAQADIANARAAVSVAKAALANSEVFWNYTKIRAPFDGVVTRRSFHNSDFIRDPEHGGDTPLLTVNRTDRMRVVVHVPDWAVPYDRKGRPATVTIDALPGKTFTGTVARVAHAEQPITRTMRTEIDLPNPDDLLTDGMYGSATIDLGRENGLVLPSAVLQGEEDEGQRYVYVVRAGHAHRVTVRVLSDDGVRAVVTAPDLKPADEVIEEYGPGLRDGAPVEVEGKAN